MWSTHIYLLCFALLWNRLVPGVRIWPTRHLLFIPVVVVVGDRASRHTSTYGIKVCFTLSFSLYCPFRSRLYFRIYLRCSMTNNFYGLARAPKHCLPLHSPPTHTRPAQTSTFKYNLRFRKFVTDYFLTRFYCRWFVHYACFFFQTYRWTFFVYVMNSYKEDILCSPTML